MKHYSAATLERLVTRADPLKTDGEPLALLRRQLAETSKVALAARLGVTEWRLTSILRGIHPLPDKVAEKLGYRKVSRFERVS